MFTDSLMVAIVAASIFVLRRRGAGEAGGGVFRMPGYPVVPALFVICLLGIVVNILLTATRLALVGTAVLAAGWPLYLAMRRATREKARGG